MSTAQVIPALAAYAAAEADVLPVEPHTTALAPSSRALDMATVMPRSLHYPVGFAPSTFSHTWAPVLSESLGARTSGVPPSFRVTTGVLSPTGRCCRYSSMTPRQPTLKRPPGGNRRCGARSRGGGARRGRLARRVRGRGG